MLRDLGARLDDLHRATATPVTARRTWLQAWVDSFPEWQPHAIVVEGRADELGAVALLATRGVGPVDRVVLLGHGPSDLLALPSRDDAASASLAAAVVRWLQDRPRAWHLYARHLRATDRATVDIASQLRCRLTSGDVSPAIVADRGPGLDHYVSGSHRRGVSRVRNRLLREGHTLAVSHVTEADDVVALLPEVERVMLERDHELGRTSDLELAGPRSFFRAVVGRHAATGEVVVTCLHVDGRLAAYVLGFVDGAAFRMWNCRFDPALARFSPGRIAMDESVRHALDHGAAVYDFMRGEERYKASYANRAASAVDLTASSHALMHAGEGVALRARSRLRAMEGAGGRSAEAADLLRRLGSRVRG